jgi:hypothetical protein
MWPDERDLAQELAGAGAAARERLGAEARPDAAWSAALRNQLVAKLPVPAARPARRSGVWGAFGGRRLALVLAAGLLSVAAGAAAGTLLVEMGRTPPAGPPADEGIEVGVPGGEAFTPTPSPSPTLTPSPTPTPTPTPSPTPVPTPTPTPVPTPTAPPATPKPTPPPLGTMGLEAYGCNGGVALEWSKVTDGRFDHVMSLRSSSASIPPAYPPSGGAVAVDGTYTKERAATSGVDVIGPAGAAFFYRTVAFDGEDRAIAASNVVSAAAQPVKSLGVLTVAPAAGGKTTVSWTPFGGWDACFSFYKLVASETDPDPSYLDGDPAIAVIDDQGASATFVMLESGTTVHMRLQAVRKTALGAFVVAQTEVLTYTAP